MLFLFIIVGLATWVYEVSLLFGISGGVVYFILAERKRRSLIKTNTRANPSDTHVMENKSRHRRDVAPFWTFSHVLVAVFGVALISLALDLYGILPTTRPSLETELLIVVVGTAVLAMLLRSWTVSRINSRESVQSS